MKNLSLLPDLKRLSLQMLLVMTCTFIHPSGGGAEMVDKVVAVVNDDIITLSELEEEAAKVSQNLAKEYTGKKLTDAIAEAKAEILETMIDRRLINQKAKRSNTTVTEEEITNAYENTRNRLSLTPDQFREKLAGSGLDEELYRKQLKDQILQSKLISYDVRAKVVVTEEMIKDYFKTHYAENSGKNSFYLLQMGFSWTKEGSPEQIAVAKAEARKKATRVLDQVRKGEDFKEAARKFSNLPSAGDGGDIGVLDLDDMAPAMRTAVTPLKPGEITDIIETENDFQFYKMLPGEEKAKASAAAYEAAKEEIREKLQEEKMKAAYSEWVKKLKEDAFIKKL